MVLGSLTTRPVLSKLTPRCLTIVRYGTGVNVGGSSVYGILHVIEIPPAAIVWIRNRLEIAIVISRPGQSDALELRKRIVARWSKTTVLEPF
jgi:hypothetical protein